MIEITDVKKTSFRLYYPRVNGASSYRVMIRQSGTDEHNISYPWITILDDSTRQSKTVRGLKNGTMYHIRVYARRDGTNYGLHYETTATPWAGFDDLDEESMSHVSLFAGGFETDHVALNEVACLSTPNVYRTRPDDGKCGMTAPTLDRQTGCCVGGVNAAEFRFLQALEAVHDSLPHAPGYLKYAADWVRENNRQIPPTDVNNHAFYRKIVNIQQGDYWYETFMKLLYVTLPNIYQHDPHNVSIKHGNEYLMFNGGFHVNGDDDITFGWMSQTGVRCRVSVYVDVGHSVPRASRLQSVTYTRGSNLTHFDITNLPQVLASSNCGSRRNHDIEFYGAPSAFVGPSYDDFLKKVIKAMVNNRDFDSMSVRYFTDYWGVDPVIVPPMMIVPNITTDSMRSLVSTILAETQLISETGQMFSNSRYDIFYTDDGVPFKFTVKAKPRDITSGTVLVKKQKMEIH